MGVRFGLAMVWMVTGLVGAGIVDMCLEPDPDWRGQLALVVLLPVIVFPALLGAVLVFAAGQPGRRGFGKAKE